MKISLIQMNSQADKADNIAAARDLMERAITADGAEFVALPEMFTHLSESREGRQEAAEEIPGGAAYGMLQETAARHKVTIHGGSILERDGDAIYNTTVAFGPDGNELARYRKIHLFDVTTPDGKEYRESATFSRGKDIVTYPAGAAVVGCSICYDLRFPELYQALAQKGANLILVPAAFTMMTGKDHWEALLRARAIETQCYVAAPGQTGSYAKGSRVSYGHSLIVNPWGHVIAQASDGVGFTSAQLDFDYLADVRSRIPIQSHKVL